MKTVRHVIKNQDGLSLIPVLMVSMVLVSLLSVWMIQFGNKANSNSAGWVQKENFRIGTELAKQVGEAYELYKQQAGCSGGAQQYINGVHFCFPGSGSGGGEETGACTTSPLLANGAKICIRLEKITMNSKPTSSKQPTFVATYVAPTRLNIFMSTAQASPLGAPPITSGSANPVTAIDCSANPATPQCHSCGGASNFACYQIAYCSVADPTCTSSSSQIKLGIMVKIN